jgi:DNA-binding NtrC family response regulator
MAGVTANCIECGFIIFDEQTKDMLCDECAKLDPIDRISGRTQRERIEKDKLDDLQAAAERNSRLRELRRRLEEQYIQRQQQERNEQMVEENKRLSEEVSALRRKLSASEIHDDDIQEVKTFLRRFDNLLLEGETEGEV